MATLSAIAVSASSSTWDAKLLDHLTYSIGEPYCFLVCRVCAVVLPLCRVPNHFSQVPHCYRRADLGRIVQAWRESHLPTHPVRLQTEEDVESWRPPADPSPHIPELPVVRANRCKFADVKTGARCSTSLATTAAIRRHCRTTHSWQNPQQAGRPSARKLSVAPPWETDVPCQRIAARGVGSSLWMIDLPADSSYPDRNHGDSHHGSGNGRQAWERLESLLDASSRPAPLSSGTSSRYPLPIDPWLEKTGWAKCLEGHDLTAVAELLAPPGSQDIGLSTLLQAFDSVIEAARETILEEKVNLFALHRVASFIPHRPFKRPLLTKLQEGTYRRYKVVWHKLLCFVYRSCVLRQGPLLPYQLTIAQSAALADLPKPYAPMTDAHLQSNRKACLALCIALIDHKLHNAIRESVVVVFLAVLGINRECNGFVPAVHCTPNLSAFVKLSQLVVVQFAVAEHEAGRAQFASERIAEMQDRFMVYGSDTPINWILNLRAYGAKIRDNTTSLGFISWSDDGQQLSYQSLELTMNNMRWFLRDQVREAQDQLHDLLLLPDGDPETRATILPHLRLSRIKDDPTMSHSGWSFLQDQRNEEMLGGHERWLLRRIRDDTKLCTRFFAKPRTLQWNLNRVEQYWNSTYAFLRRMLLLIHMTGGQPARGTELLTIRWRNSSGGEVRSMFVENGLVSFVTSYHKNYSLHSSAKVIHRYLPPEVSEVVVYYIWLVLPFLEQLLVLAPLPGQGPLGSFFWPRDVRLTKRQKEISHEEKVERDEPWSSSQLGKVIEEEFRRGLKTTANILTWRHSAIAISRKHLPEGSRFKRDYSDVETSKAMDLQAAHTSRMAGGSYARDLREGPGQVASLRAEYRDLSRHWHTCLGFGTVLAPRQSMEDDHHDEALREGQRSNINGRKRKHEAETDKELQEWLLTDAILGRRRKDYKLRKRSGE